METYLSTTTKLLCLSILFFSLSYCSNAITVSSGGIPPVRAVNLGGWLVTEGWMKPTLFDGITNKDFLDGTGLQLKSVTLGKFLSAELGGGATIVANRTSASGWETFKLWRLNATYFNFRVYNNQFVGLDTSGNVVCVANAPGATETFQIQISPNNPQRVKIRAPNGSFLQAKEELLTADYQGNDGWGDDNPSVFLLTFSGILQGEYQVTNGYGPRASQVMNEHWSTFIVEEDFNFIKNNGLNAVRIPVGWWTAYDPSPPRPYVAGSLQALDNAFRWAEKYDIQVILDLHAAPGAQNSFDHSGTRDGSQEWGTDDNIQQTVHVISFLTARYAGSTSLFAVELLNEPKSPGVSLKTLTDYYQLGYNAVREHSETAYVVLSNRLGPMQAKELFPLASGLSKSVVDVHYYNLFWDEKFKNTTVEQNIQFVHNDRSAQINEMTESNGPLILVGEWSAEWEVKDASKEDYQKYASAQIEVFGKATFGWAYWSLCMKVLVLSTSYNKEKIINVLYL